MFSSRQSKSPHDAFVRYTYLLTQIWILLTLTLRLYTFAFEGIKLWVSTSQTENRVIFGTPIPFWYGCISASH